VLSLDAGSAPPARISAAERGSSSAWISRTGGPVRL
jgi:hypothetical protein